MNQVTTMAGTVARNSNYFCYVFFGIVMDDIKEQIRNNSDIVDIVSEYLNLKKSGHGYKGLCPFHSEKTPSFHVNPEKNIFRCFGCGAGGDVFEFVSKIEKLSFFETLERLGKRCGIDVRKKSENSREKQLRNSIYTLNKIASEYYRDILTNNQEAYTANQYIKKRGLTPDIISKFMIGYTGSKWDGLHQLLNSKNIPVEVQEKAGLIRKNENRGNYRDRFRNRIVFPIMNISGDIAGFGGRIIEKNDKAPKYLNSPETIVYKKSELLYGFHIAKDFIRKKNQAVLVEGYMDLIPLNQAGIENVIATCGTALTEHHVRLLKRFTDSVTIVFDGDLAGIKAADMSSHLLMDGGLNVKIIELPEGKDPDEYINTKGKDAFIELLDKAAGLVDFKIEKYLKECSNDDVMSKVACVNKLLPYLSRITNSIENGYYITKIAQRLGVSEISITDELKKAVKGNYDVVGSDSKIIKKEKSPAEKSLIQLMLNDFSIINDVMKNISGEEFQDSDFSEIVSGIYHLHKKGAMSIGNLLEYIQNENTRKIVTRLSIDKLKMNNIDENIQDCLRDIKRKRDKLPGLWKIKDSKYERMELLKKQLDSIKQEDKDSKIIH